MPGGWKGSTRRGRLPSGWAAMAAETLREQPVCRCDGCPRCFSTGMIPCQRASTDVDHIVPGDDHSKRNRRGLCNPCHRVKSSAEGNAARRRQSTTWVERHPGRLA